MSQVAVVGYSLSALGYLAFFFLMVSAWRGRLFGGALAAVCLVNFLWAACAIWWHESNMALALLGYGILEALRYLAWIYFIYQLLGPLQEMQLKTLKFYFRLKPWLFGICGLLVLTKFVPHIAVWFRDVMGLNVHILGLLLLTVAGSVLTEELYRHTRNDQRWSIKFLCLGLLTLFVIDFYLYAEALLFNRINLTAEASRGYITVFSVLLLAVAVFRNPKWSGELFVSRSIVLRSVSVILAGGYLVLMAIAGYYIKSTGADWGDALQLVFFTAAILALALFAISGQVRSRVKLFFNKHFFAYQYDYREQWLRFTQTLSKAHTGRNFHEHAIRALAELVDSNGAMLWTQNERGHFQFVEHWCMKPPPGLDMVEPSTLIEFLKKTGWVVELAEFREQPERYEGLKLPAWLEQLPGLWAIVPLLQGDELQGFVLLASPRALKRINWEDRDLLKTAGHQLASYVALYAATVALVDARQFEAFNRLSAYVVHDLKNVSAQLSLIVTNAVKHKQNPAFIDDAFATVENATNRMNRMLQQLRKDRPAAVDLQPVNVGQVVEQVVAQRQAQLPRPTLKGVPEPVFVRAEQERLSAILNHLVQNAQEATPDDGQVMISVSATDEDVEICVRDSGAGMSEEFIRRRLFRPFDTTKGNAGMGIGVYQSREVIHSFGGQLMVSSREGEGSEFLVRLSRAQSHELEGENLG